MNATLEPAAIETDKRVATSITFLLIWVAKLETSQVLQSNKNKNYRGHSDSLSVSIAQWIHLRTTIMPTGVRVPSSQSMLLPFIDKFLLYLSNEKNENKQEEAVVWPILKEVRT